MKTILLILCITSFSNILYPQEEVKRKDGKAIIIYNDGTWKYKDEGSIKKQIVNKLIAIKWVTQAEVNECGGVDKVIYSLEEIDLNKDGNPEIIADFNCDYHQGFMVFRKIDNKLEIIFDCGGCERVSIKPLQTYAKGWRNLQLDSYSAGTGESSSEVLHWNGREYK